MKYFHVNEPHLSDDLTDTRDIELKQIYGLSCFKRYGVVNAFIGKVCQTRRALRRSRFIKTLISQK